MRAALILLLLASPASADNVPHREGDYGGVSPGQPQGQKTGPAVRPARPKRPPPKGTLTWIGFETRDGGAQVFLQSVAPFEVEQRVEGSTLIVHLNLSRLGGNTWRQVDTRFFDNPLAGIIGKAARGTRTQKSGIDVRITFKNPKDARQGTLRTATEADGMYYAYLMFPEGADAKQPTINEPER